jgi:hypothetical protein
VDFQDTELGGREWIDQNPKRAMRLDLVNYEINHWRTEGGGEVRLFKLPPPRNSEVFTKLSRIPSSLENTSVTTSSEYGFHSFANRAEPLTRGLPPPDPIYLCSLSLAEFVETPRTKFLDTPLK